MRQYIKGSGNVFKDIECRDPEEKLAKARNGLNEAELNMLVAKQQMEDAQNQLWKSMKP